MTRGESEMLALNLIGLENSDIREKYRDKSVSEVLESEFGTAGKYIDIDKTLSADEIHG